MAKQYAPRVYNSSTSISLSSDEEVTILDEEFEGKISEIYVTVQDKDMEVILEVDGEEVYRLNLGDLDSDYLLDETDILRIGSLNNGKHFFDVYNDPVDFNSSVKFKVKNVDSKSRSIFSYFIRLRKTI